MTKLVDSEFLGHLLGGCYEAAMGAVEEAVADHPDLFGGTDETDVRVVGTYSDHAIVTCNEEFFRCEWSMTDGDVTLSNVKKIDVPTKESTEISQSTIRRQYESAVDSLLECDSKSAEEKLKGLLDLAYGGVPMTAEAVEIVFQENRARFVDSEWAQVITEKEESVRRFIGADALRLAYPKPKFEHITGESVEESAADSRRDQVVEGLKEIKSFLARLHEQTTLARKVDEGYKFRGSESSDDTTSDFMEFMSSFKEDLDGMITIMDDALAVAEDGCAKCLARLHDGIAGQMREWAMAAAFAERMARRFDAQQAA